MTCAESAPPSDQTRAHHGGHRARRTRGAPREQPPRRHHGDLRDLRVVRHPRRATKRGYIAAGTKNTRSSQGAAATTTSRRPARRASPAPSDRTRAYCGGHEECAKLPGSSRHDDIAATCASCITRAKRPNTSTSRRATRNTRSSQGAVATTTSQRPARRALPPPIVRARAHRGEHEERAELPGSSRHDDIAATCASCVAHAKQPQREHITHSGHDAGTELLLVSLYCSLVSTCSTF
jgi:hypothetical protein